MSDKKVYLYVTPFFPSPESWRGAYCYDFVRALREQVKVIGEGEQWKVLVFVPGAGEDYEIGGVKVYRFPTRQLPSNILPLLFRRYNERSFLNKVSQVLSSTVHLHLSPSPQIAICHAHTANYAIYALAAKRALGAKALLHHHDLQSFGLNLGRLRHLWIYNAWLFCQFRKLFEQIDIHVFISGKSRESFLRAPDTSWTIFDDYLKQMRGPRLFHCRPVRIKRSIILHNGVDTDIFFKNQSSTVDLLSRPTFSYPSFTIGCIANFLDLKDQETLIRAVEKVVEVSGSGRADSSTIHSTTTTTNYNFPSIRVLFIGSGPLLSHCQRLAQEIEFHCSPSPSPSSSPSPSPSSSPSPLTFTFLPEVPHEDLTSFYRSLDLFVLPSYFEGFGCVLTEAWSCGVPFIACEGQGIDDLFRTPTLHSNSSPTPWLFKPRDVNDLADKIANFMRTRPRQHLVQPVGIAETVSQFVKELGL